MAGEEEKNGDFYAVLGLNKKCTASELRDAYKKLALKWHPDRCSASGNSKFIDEAKEKFQDIQEAYSVLSDENKRFLYDVGAYESDEDENGMGDFLGEMAAMMCQTKPSGNFSVFIVEALAVRSGLSFVGEMRIPLECVEGDSCEVMNEIAAESHRPTEEGNIIEDCRSLLATWPNVIVKAISRDGNNVAHRLCKFGLSLEALRNPLPIISDLVVIEACPPFGS